MPTVRTPTREMCQLPHKTRLVVYVAGGAQNTGGDALRPGVRRHPQQCDGELKWRGGGAGEEREA